MVDSVLHLHEFWVQTNAEEILSVNWKRIINCLIFSDTYIYIYFFFFQHTQFCSHFLKEGWIVETYTSIHEYYSWPQAVDQAIFRMAKHLSQLKPGNITVGRRRTHRAIGHSMRGRGTQSERVKHMLTAGSCCLHRGGFLSKLGLRTPCLGVVYSKQLTQAAQAELLL